MNVNNVNTSNNVILPVTIILLPTTIPVLGEQKTRWCASFIELGKDYILALGQMHRVRPAGWIRSWTSCPSATTSATAPRKGAPRAWKPCLGAGGWPTDRRLIWWPSILRPKWYVCTSQHSVLFFHSCSWWFLFLLLPLPPQLPVIIPYPLCSCLFVFLFDGLTDSLQD